MRLWHRSARATGWLLGLVMATCTLFYASPAAAAELGVYRGAADANAISTFEGWLGRPVDKVLTYLADDDWSKISSPTWWLDSWGPTPYFERMTYAVPLLPEGGGTLARGAAGDYNDHFRALAELLVARGQQSATLRLGWEFNGDWYRWSINVKNGPANYAKYWRHIVRTMRGVRGSNFKFDWCSNNGSVPKALDVEKAYPGNAYVDFISQDVYDQSWPATSDPEARWRSIRDGKHGLQWVADFARSRGKPLAVPEWGLGYNANGGGDNPRFIELMHDWISSHPVAYHIYFDRHGSALDLNPDSADVYRRLFGHEDTAAITETSAHGLPAHLVFPSDARRAGLESSRAAAESLAPGGAPRARTPAVPTVKVKLLHGRLIEVWVPQPSKARVRVRVANCRAGRTMCRPGRLLLQRTQTVAAGHQTVSLRLSRASRRSAVRAGRLSVEIAYKGGSRQVVSVRVRVPR